MTLAVPKERCIIAFDVDNFYVASERLRDPSLIGKPVAIQQKTITATCSYEARERGVRKLCLIGDAKRMCPDIIIISGEDLTFYRRDSRRIWRLVTALVGQSPEKLGMDELFLDVTTLVESHLANAEDRGARYFRLSRPGEPDRGFSYTDELAGLTMPSTVGADTYIQPRHIVASKLSAFIRAKIAEEIGFTTSGGIAPTKLLAKLLASENKPSKQTCWVPPPSDPAHGQRALEGYIANIPLKQLNGFGHRIVLKIRLELLGEQPTEDVLRWVEEPSDYKTSEHDKAWEPLNVRIDEKPLLVGQVRDMASCAQFEAWFGERLGSRLWGLLWGVDDEAVVPAPEFPKQISVEDSYLRAKLPTVALALQKISSLALSLLTRLEAELVDEPAALAGLSRPRTWARHPTQIRLTLRKTSGPGSKTAPMPLDTLDLDGPPLATRAEDLAAAFHVLFRRMVGANGPARDDDRCSFHVINLSVVNFEANGPTPSVRTLLGKRVADIGISPSKRRPPTTTSSPIWSAEDGDADENGDGEREQCTICDHWVPSFAMPAHLSWHIEPG